MSFVSLAFTKAPISMRFTDPAKRSNRSSRNAQRHVEMLEPRQLLNATPQGPEFRVNTTTLRDQFAPAIASDATGNFVVVWAGENDPHQEDIDIFAQRFNSVGVPQGSEFRVNTFTTGVQSNPVVAMDADGDFVVVWQSGTSDPSIFAGQDGSGSGVYAQRYNAAGVTQGVEFRVNQFTTNDQQTPTVAMDSNGNFAVAWETFAQDGNGWGVFARRYNSAGTPQANEFLVNTFTTNTQLKPSAAMDSNGNFAIAWTSGTLASPGGQDGSFYGIYAKRYNASGVVQGGEFRVNTFTTDFQTDPSVGMDSDGDFVIAWNSFGQDGSDYGIFAQRYNASGVPQGGEFRVNTFTSDAQSDPRVDMTADGRFVVVWGSTAQDGSGRGVYAKCYNANGTVNGSEFRVNNFTPNNQNRPAITVHGDGDFVVVFQDGSTTPNVNGQDGSGYGIYARRYSTQGDTIPPTVTNAAFNFLTSQSLTFTFSEDVSASLSTNDIMVQNLTTNQTISTASMALSYNALTNTATVTFPGLGAFLPDGNYRATLLAAGITDAAGNPLDGNGDGVGGDNYLFAFWFLNGDGNRDRVVDLSDFNRLAANFGESPRDFSQGDFNYDGVVNLQDFNILAARFGMSLPEPLAALESTGGDGKTPTARGALAGPQRGNSTPFSTTRVKEDPGERLDLLA